ncbi:MAG: sigma-70 family RNA polymerase sigma factor [Pirellulales bacterium]|nr:sigma-70 family RNA polymerase sigma factor [Pirellulales bacterium]
MHDETTPGDVPRAKIDWQAELARHERWLRTIVRARVREPDGVDDVMQEIALAALRQQAPIVDAAKIAPWLYRVAVMQSLLYRRTHGRRRKLHERVAKRDPPTEADTSAVDPLDWLLRTERRDLVREAIDTLPDRDAEILLLKYNEGWKYQQIADHVGISHSAVEARLHRARARLRKRLTEMNVVEATSPKQAK